MAGAPTGGVPKPPNRPSTPPKPSSADKPPADNPFGGSVGDALSGKPGTGGRAAGAARDAVGADNLPDWPGLKSFGRDAKRSNLSAKPTSADRVLGKGYEHRQMSFGRPTDGPPGSHKATSSGREKAARAHQSALDGDPAAKALDRPGEKAKAAGAEGLKRATLDHMTGGEVSPLKGMREAKASGYSPGAVKTREGRAKMAGKLTEAGITGATGGSGSGTLAKVGGKVVQKTADTKYGSKALVAGAGMAVAPSLIAPVMMLLAILAVVSLMGMVMLQAVGLSGADADASEYSQIAAEEAQVPDLAFDPYMNTETDVGVPWQITAAIAQVQTGNGLAPPDGEARDVDASWPLVDPAIETEHDGTTWLGPFLISEDEWPTGAGDPQSFYDSTNYIAGLLFQYLREDPELDEGVRFTEQRDVYVAALDRLPVRGFGDSAPVQGASGVSVTPGSAVNAAPLPAGSAEGDEGDEDGVESGGGDTEAAAPSPAPVDPMFIVSTPADSHDTATTTTTTEPSGPSCSGTIYVDTTYNTAFAQTTPDGLTVVEVPDTSTALAQVAAGSPAKAVIATSTAGDGAGQALSAIIATAVTIFDTGDTFTLDGTPPPAVTITDLGDWTSGNADWRDDSGAATEEGAAALQSALTDPLCASNVAASDQTVGAPSISQVTPGYVFELASAWYNGEPAPCGAGSGFAGLLATNGPINVGDLLQDGGEMTAEMMGNAQQILQVAQELGMSERGMVIALITALQESRLLNLEGGDRDSRGLFQQRDQYYGGGPTYTRDVLMATRMFFGPAASLNLPFSVPTGLLDYPGWETMHPGDAAQTVQRSGFPRAYDKWIPDAVGLVESILDAFDNDETEGDTTTTSTTSTTEPDADTDTSDIPSAPDIRPVQLGGGCAGAGGVFGTSFGLGPNGPIALAEVVSPTGHTWTVNAQIAANLQAMVNAAHNDSIVLGGWGYRSHQRQIELRAAHCGSSQYAIYEMPSSSCSPPTATPGSSMHELGLAIDFTHDGVSVRSRSNPAFQWLAANAAQYGFLNLPSEPWHWSANGR